MSTRGPSNRPRHRIALLALILALTPGCFSYAHVRAGTLPGTGTAIAKLDLPATEVAASGGAWSASGGFDVQMEGACASVGPCAGAGGAGAGVGSGFGAGAGFGAGTGSATVTVAGSDSASVAVSDSASVSGSASVTVSDSASVSVSDSASASVSVSDSASVTVADSASASASDSASASASASISGTGRGLLAVSTTGVTLPDGRIAALELLTPLAGSGFTADARVGGDASLTCDAALAHDALPASGGASSVVVRIAGGTAAPSHPIRVHLVIDASTSMASTWHHVQEAALHLLARLRPQDELQIVVYGTGANEALAPVRVGDGARARSVIRALRPEGRTNIEAGLRIAYRAIRPHASIVLLLSDGVPNGGLSLPTELGALSADASARGAVTTAIGLGWDFQPDVLGAIATEGQGRFRIAPRVGELSDLLDAELALRARIAAHDVSVDVALAPGVTAGTLPAGTTSVEGRIRISIPSIAAGEERVIVIPVAVAPSQRADARAVATIDAQWTPATATRAQVASKDLALAVAPAPIAAGESLAVLDADLATALTASARAVTNGDAAAAAQSLRDHALRAQAHLRVRAHAPLDTRTAHVLAIATSLEQLVPAASWTDRRAMGASMLSFSIGFSTR